MYVLMTGRPTASDSKNTLGNPSAKLGKTNARAASSSSRTPLVAQVTGNSYLSLQAILFDQPFDLRSHRSITDDDKLESQTHDRADGQRLGSELPVLSVPRSGQCSPVVETTGQVPDRDPETSD